eukprot:12288381-Ditylum_brightwellii.AAC.1
MDLDEGFIPRVTKGRTVFFDTRAPTDVEIKKLPIVLITGLVWDSIDDAIYPHGDTKESK